MGWNFFVHHSGSDKSVNIHRVYLASYNSSSVLLGCGWEHLCIHAFPPSGLYSAHLLLIQPHQHRCWNSSFPPLPDCPAKRWKQLSGHSVFHVLKHYFQCCFPPRVQICRQHLFLVLRPPTRPPLISRLKLFDMPTQWRGPAKSPVCNLFIPEASLAQLSFTFKNH